ncbi:MAG: acyloxyacyl hydrolase [Prevotellaceae bacterium]|nr:acyloxyacyl hydrolase [Prevotellaceae bacterium]
MKHRLSVLLLSLIAFVPHIPAMPADSLRRVGFSVSFNPGNEVKMDKYQRKWMKGTRNYSVGAECHFMSLPQDSDAYAADFGYPTLSVGMKYSFNHGVTMHRSPDEVWGKAQEVDYDSRMGNSVAVYGSFARPLLRSQRWEIDYTFNFGVGYTAHKYNTVDAIDNELIGSRWLIFFGAGVHATCRIAPTWGIKGGVEYWHLSNGALNRPNKGANFIGPSLGICYYPYYEQVADKAQRRFSLPFRKYLYVQLATGVGAKALHEDWQLTQFNTAKGEENYRTDKFRRYVCYSVRADVMYRYARRWASGLGVEVFYGSHYRHVEELDRKNGSTLPHSPWSIGIAAKHEVFYHNFSMPVALGVYLFRQMGENAQVIEKPFYERIGIHYSFPRWGGLKVGINVNAHLTKADFTEVALGIPLRLK